MMFKKKSIRYSYIVLISIFQAFFSLQAHEIGSDLSVSVESHYTFTDSENQINSFAWMKSGFELADPTVSCTFQSVFPVGGLIDLKGGTVYLNTDLCFNEQAIFKNVGMISSGQAQTVDFAPTMTYFGSPAFTSVFDNISLFIHHDVALKEDLVITRDVIINGNNHVLNLIEGKIYIKKESSLTFNNISLVGIEESNIICEDPTSRIILKDVIWYQDSNTFTFTQGSIEFKNSVSLMGTATFVYASSATSTIAKNSILKIGDGMHLYLGKASLEAVQPLYFEDPNSALYFNNSYFHITQYGASLTRGSLYISGKLDVDVTGTFSDVAFSLGGATYDDDLRVELLSGSNVTFLNGYVVANFYNPSNFIAESVTTRIVRNPENVFVLQNDLVLGNVGIEAKDGSELYFAEGKNLYYDNVTIYLDKTALELTGQRFNSYTNLLNGSNEIFISKGTLPAYTRVSNDFNYLRGQGVIDGLVYLTDTGARLICDFDGNINKSMHLNGGTIQLARNLNSAYDATIIGEGTLDLGNNTWYLGSKESLWNNDLFIKGTLGTIQCNANIVLDGTVSISGNIVLEGRFHQLTFNSNGSIVVQPDSILTLRNLTLTNLNGLRLSCVDNTAKIIFENTRSVLDNLFTCSLGSFEIKDQVEFTGTSTFAYESPVSMEIDSASTLLINGIGFEVKKSGPGAAEPLIFQDKTGTLQIKNGAMKTGRYGMNFLKGTLVCENDVNFSFYSTNSIDALVMGDLTNANDATISFVAGASITYNPGVMVFNNYSPYMVVSRSNITKISRMQNSVFYYNADMVLPYLTIISQSTAFNFVANNKSLSFQKCVVIGDGYEFDLTGKRFNQFTNTLSGNQEIFITKGILPASTRVQGSGNIIRGTGDVSGKITLIDQNATLTLALNGSLYQSVPLNNGTVVVARDMNMAYNSVFTGSGVLALEKATIVFGLQESAWTGTIAVKSTQSSLALRNKMSLSGLMTVSGNLTIDGNSNLFEFMPTGRLVVAPNSTLQLKNILLKNLAGLNLSATDSSSKILFENAAGILSADYSYTTGLMSIEDEVSFGGAYTFTLAPPAPVAVAEYSSLTFNNDITCAIGRYGSINGTEPLNLADNTVDFAFNNATLRVLPTGMTLTRGNWVIDENITLDILSTSTEGGFWLGDETSQNDPTTILLSGSRVNFYRGHLVYNCSVPGQIQSFSKNSNIKICNAGFFYLNTDCLLSTVYLESEPLSVVYAAEGKSLHYNNCLFESRGEQFNMTGIDNQGVGFALGGDDIIIMARGTYPAPTFISNANNSIIGTGNIAQVIVLQDADAQLHVKVQGDLLSPVSMNQSTLYVDHDVYFNNDGMIDGSGQIYLESNALHFSHHAQTVTHTLTWVSAENGKICLHNDVDFFGAWHLSGNIIIDGENGYDFVFQPLSSLTVAPGSSLYFKNITLKNITEMNCILTDSTSSITFDNCSLLLNDHFTCTANAVVIKNSLSCCGPYSLIFNTINGVQILSQSTLQINDGIQLSMHTINRDGNPLSFTDNTSQFVCSDATLNIENESLSFLKGKTTFKGKSCIHGSSSDYVLSWGDETFDNDASLIIKAGAILSVNNITFAYKNISASMFFFDQGSAINVLSNASIALYQNMSATQGLLHFYAGSRLARKLDATLSVPIQMLGEIVYDILV
jgi:hypothetical protein